MSNSRESSGSYPKFFADGGSPAPGHYQAAEEELDRFDADGVDEALAEANSFAAALARQAARDVIQFHVPNLASYAPGSAYLECSCGASFGRHDGASDAQAAWIRHAWLQLEVEDQTPGTAALLSTAHMGHPTQ